MNQQSIFPALSRRVATAFAETEPVVIDGMKVQFDEQVALFPANVELDKGDVDGGKYGAYVGNEGGRGERYRAQSASLWRRRHAGTKVGLSGNRHAKGTSNGNRLRH